jgi:hypothetical protein
MATTRKNGDRPPRRRKRNAEGDLEPPIPKSKKVRLRLMDKMQKELEERNLSAYKRRMAYLEKMRAEKVRRIPQGETGLVGKVGNYKPRVEDVSQWRLSRAINQAVQRGREELADEIRAMKHPLAYDLLTRFEIKEKYQQGEKLSMLAKEYGTSVRVVKEIIKLREDLPKGRQEEVAKQFFKLSRLLDDVLQLVADPRKVTNASFAQQMLGVGVLSDKVMAIRRALDGDAAKRVEVNVPSFADKEQMVEALRQKLDTLKPILEARVVEAEVVEEQKVEEEDRQLALFDGGKES